MSPPPSALQVKCPDTPLATLVHCHASLLAVFLEHLRLSPLSGVPAGESHLSDVLQTAGWPTDRQAALVSLAEQAAGPGRRLLSSLGHGSARLVDIRWKEVATVTSSLTGGTDPGEQDEQGTQFELTLITLPPGGEVEELTVCCSRHQLQAALAELRQAGRAMQSLAEGAVTPPPPPSGKAI